MTIDNPPSKLFIAIFPNGKREKVLAKSAAEAAKEFSPFLPQEVLLAFQPDPKVFRIMDTETLGITDYRNVEAVLGPRFIKVPHIDLERLRLVFISSRFYRSKYSVRVFGFDQHGATVFHLLTDEFRDRGSPSNEVREILAYITENELPLVGCKVSGDETRVGRLRDLHNRDSVTGGNCFDDFEKRDDLNLFRYKDLRFTLA